MSVNQESTGLVGRSMPRVEDAALLTGRGRYIDDLPTRRDTAHLAILRSPHAHAEIRSINASKALALDGVHAVITGDDVASLTRSLTVGVKANVECWPMARERVRYVGEPVALVVAETRYLAEDALDLIEVDYGVLPVVMDPKAALQDEAPLLHPSLGSNCISERSFRYGDPEKAFSEARHRIAVEISYPRNSCTPIETYGVIAEYDPGEDAYDVTANFQGPFSIHAVVALALKVPGNRMRLRTPPDSGGSFGVKQGVFVYAILAAVAARISGRPVKWIEDRLEHLMASVSATNRVTRLEAAVEPDGRVTALSWDQIEDCGAHLRAPEPATLYRMHGNMTGAYAISNLAIRNRVVLTNKTPTGLNRGFGGPQIYYPLERLMHRIADELGLDRLEVIRRNLVPSGAFPYRTASGALLDSGDYVAAFEAALKDGGFDDLVERRKRAREAGKLYGIGLAAAVEPSVSNMGYITTVLTPQERAKAGPKNGAQAVATIGIDPLGAVTVKVASVPQGQGHRTVLAQVVADRLGLPFEAVRVNTELDTGRDAWSIASGNYSSRFAAAVAGTARLAADRIRERLAAIAASQLNVEAAQVEFAGGRIFDRNNPDNSVSFNRVAASSHWAPGTLPDGIGHTIRETVFWTPEQLEAPTPVDGINSSLCHGFIFDFCGIEIDPATGAVRIDKYVTMHDCGRILHSGMVEGQVRGAFAQAVGAALFEEYAYGEDGSFLSGTLADYLMPTVMETPEPVILHYESPSPFTPLGAKGVGEGNCMSTPVCIANAIADATGASDITLPLSPGRIADLIFGEEKPSSNPQARKPAKARPGERQLTGEGSATVAASREAVWKMLLDPATLEAIIPGAHGVEKVSATHFRADVTLGVGPVKGRYRAEIKLSDMVEPEAVTLSGSTQGALGFGSGVGRITLTDADGKTVVGYRYEAGIGGKVASVGGRLLDGAARVVIGQFFQALARHAGGGSGGGGILARLKALLGGRS
ncbi:carbon monoxide dehydrogenase [Nitratireductor indicus C115]|uniref:Carbon monoxide dehydrogenase n=1 Tax=Nitratireductor indicus C115 TaxID=1231190 RepID=K2NXN7_9HYPH|nr:molybdopterin cofactor-binding domain-containing protein [Nitratireductor indicus]EKF42659.1 carbon monoxide dehydrogenase [Nitratireductor indicus C115]SFQ38412.1 2-furoyl-CoA dehydrogenase large subunit [Nitratireductor indicus]